LRREKEQAGERFNPSPTTQKRYQINCVEDCIFLHLFCQTRKCRGGLWAEHDAENLQIIWSRDRQTAKILVIL